MNGVMSYGRFRFERAVDGCGKIGYNSFWILLQKRGRGGIGRLDGFRCCHLSEGFLAVFVPANQQLPLFPAAGKKSAISSHFRAMKSQG